MIFRQLLDYASFTYTYLIGDETSGEAIIIDSVKERAQQHATLVQELGLTLIASLETHTHADHITGAGALKQHFPEMKILTAMESKVEGNDDTFSDQSIIAIGSLSIIALHTPGHTDDSYSFVMDDRVFTGDTLFIRGTGRTDFQNGDAAQEFHSISEKLFTLAKSTKVYPGHDYNGNTASTIGEEIDHNPRIKNQDIQAFVAIMDNLNLPKPKLLDVALPANLKCGFELNT